MRLDREHKTKNGRFEFTAVHMSIVDRIVADTES